MNQKFVICVRSHSKEWRIGTAHQAKKEMDEVEDKAEEAA